MNYHTDNKIDGERRQLIKLVGAGLALGTLGVGSATAGTGRYVVGTASRGATREARSKARSVDRILDFGRYGQAVSGQFSQQALDALAAGHEQGGDKREELRVQSAALVVADTEERESEPFYDDLRMDATETPISDLRETYELAVESFEAASERYGENS